ncbi:KR domain-containing protein [Paraphaeosphaeria sporulosa]
MEHGFIPPNIHLSTVNPDILNPLKPTPWPACQTKCMSVSGFGMGGTNAHLVLEEHQKEAIAQHTIDLGQLRRAQNSWPTWHTRSPLRDQDYLGKRHNTIELREQLSTSLGDTAARGWSGKHPSYIGLVFMGQGAQWARMGIELLDRRVFRESVSKSTQYVREMGCDWDPVAELRKAPAESRVGEPEGVYPSKVVGHSSGEIAAAYSIGALSHRDALAVAFFRGKVFEPQRGMMAVGCTPELAQEIFIERNLQATVACVNSPASITLSGNAEVLNKLQSVYDERVIFARRLKPLRAVSVDHATQSRIKIACRDEDEHELVKRAAEKIGAGSRVLRDELFPVKIDNVKRTAVLDERDEIKAGAAEAFGEENGTTVAKIAWLSKRDVPKAYGPMASFTLVENLARQARSNTGHGPGNATNAKSSATKHISAKRCRDAGDAAKTATTTRAAAKR